MGKNGWLYYFSATDGSIVGDYRRSNLDPEASLEKLAGILVRRRDVLRQRGAEYIIVIAPNKGSVYPEYLPDSFAGYNGPSRYDRIMEYLSAHTDLRIVNLKKVLIEARKTTSLPLYEINGTRWNDLGAFVAYQEICRTLSEVFPGLKPKKFSDYTISETNCVRDLEKMLACDGIRTPLEPTMNSATMLTINFGVRGLVSCTNTTGQVGLLPKTMAFRDCFCSRLGTFFADHCEQFDAYWSMRYSDDLVEKEKPGLVIQELAERYIDNL